MIYNDPYLRHVQLVLVLRDLLPQGVDLVRLAGQLRPRLVLSPLGQISLEKRKRMNIEWSWLNSDTPPLGHGGSTNIDSRVTLQARE